MMNQVQDPVVVDDRFICYRFGVSASTTQRLRKQAQNPLPHFKVRGQVRYNLAAVEKYFSQNAEAATAA